MSELRFYHLTRTLVERALPDLLEKTLARGWRAVVRTDSTARAESLAAHLWAYRPDSFLPHGTSKDGRAQRQPIWITAEDERPNDAQVLFLVHGAQEAAQEAAFDLVCTLLDDQDEPALSAARSRWKAARAAGAKVSYWEQTDSGWHQKA